MTFEKIVLQEKLDEVLTLLNESDDSFVREAFFLSHSYLENKYLVEPDSLGDLVLFIVSPSGTYEGFEFLVKDVTEIRLQFEYQIKTSGTIGNQTGVRLKLNDFASTIIGGSIHYRLHEKVNFGRKSLYGIKSISSIEKAEDEREQCVQRIRSAGTLIAITHPAGGNRIQRAGSVGHEETSLRRQRYHLRTGSRPPLQHSRLAHQGE